MCSITYFRHNLSNLGLPLVTKAKKSTPSLSHQLIPDLKTLTDVPESPVRVDGKKKEEEKKEIGKKSLSCNMSAVMSGRQDGYITNMQS